MPETLNRADSGAAAARLTTILERYWGYPSFRPLQREATEAILAGLHDGGAARAADLEALARRSYLLRAVPATASGSRP